MLQAPEIAPNPALFTSIPETPQQKKPGQLTNGQLKQFFGEGYLMVPDFFSKDELQPVRDAIETCVDSLVNKLYDSGKIKDKHIEAGLFQRFALIEKEFPGAGVVLHKHSGRLSQAFRNLWSNDRLLNVVEQMIGPNIAGHPVWNLRVKPPQCEQATVPWHQDNAYLDSNALNVLQPTAWIPLLDATELNGCMKVARGGHKSGILGKHIACAGDTWYVYMTEEEMVKTLGVNMKEDIVTCEVPYGGVLFINNMIPHVSLENYSNDIRWSLDLRWQRPDLPNGFYGLKDNVLMRTSDNPNMEIDFDTFDKVDRNKILEDTDEFDTTIPGPWMTRWGVTHHNRHTAKLLESPGATTWHKS
ncbi:uncharacterized protein LOC100368117 [Saccoglossus kowalevskii]|uniref:Phytanoyl-CoA dioxygenase 2-like n=1 Tax=Saccoglossus kowalevskii TaxID=10224 RepID=A0ABM0M3F5_SACKO|nr:PREDICTED: phytanoyl-CoA dioxygenase 2-like [Saccoglossus kowalevskii]